MMTFKAFLLLAQATLLSSPGPSPTSPMRPLHEPHEAHVSHTRHHAMAAPALTPEVRITIVNATCVPSIALGVGLGQGPGAGAINGARGTGATNKPIAYSDFHQGEWTANQTISTPEVHYIIRSTNGALVGTQTIRFQPVSSQYLLLTGDLSTRGPAEKLPQVLGDAAPRGVCLPNVQFHVIPYALVTSDPCHYRIINAMPGKTLLLQSPASENKAAQQLAYLAPGNSVLLVHQPPCVSYEAVIDGQSIPLEIEQEGAEGNCLIPFFLRNGKPNFVRVFEDP